MKISLVCGKMYHLLYFGPLIEIVFAFVTVTRKLGSYLTPHTN